jgi:hypothetical protein
VVGLDDYHTETMGDDAQEMANVKDVTCVMFYEARWRICRTAASCDMCRARVVCHRLEDLFLGWPREEAHDDTCCWERIGATSAIVEHVYNWYGRVFEMANVDRQQREG